jgi:hypothetical protein
MVFRVLSASFAVAVISLNSLPAIAATAQTPEFSATIIMKSNSSTANAKIFYTPKKQRMEVTAPDSDGKNIIITRLDKEVVWMLMTSEEMYTEISLDNDKKNQLVQEPDNIIKRERIGRDTVDGHPATKDKITFRQDDGKKNSIYSWTATDLGWPVKAEALDGSWSYTYKDIRKGRQDPALFDVPKGYKRMSGFQPPVDEDQPEADYAGPDYHEPLQPYYPSLPDPHVPDMPSQPVPW